MTRIRITHRASMTRYHFEATKAPPLCIPFWKFQNCLMLGIAAAALWQISARCLTQNTLPIFRRDFQGPFRLVRSSGMEFQFRFLVPIHFSRNVASLHDLYAAPLSKPIPTRFITRSISLLYPTHRVKGNALAPTRRKWKKKNGVTV